ncbi:hypothetical protein A3F27_02150 [Candidatus Kaiserbacteria bacterium RIFCSPHIGHO2_12_FULL_53_13]|uniref:Uncharacterized protein n=1 Tax=Candidatus Kaiserbacteria bacterium RIFCSPHIGHO2_12_FULL_53_13 TaxID=1798502 RepID=A0A1F6EBR9_9BACT|nr:MAG: hypothetical protein A3F27_02150 [Candidatus Kaiserbacteria bacterium RIFCSPHIGHO2_12_FULL_53_13]OGG74710.1 MAG: hypothetical protein A3A37_02500 [Candidatus Kaiserbacteria bacterium RIFCSPLOWO2_01_FULL_52_36]
MRREDAFSISLLHRRVVMKHFARADVDNFYFRIEYRKDEFEKIKKLALTLELAYALCERDTICEIP